MSADLKAPNILRYQRPLGEPMRRKLLIFIVALALLIAAFIAKSYVSPKDLLTRDAYKGDLQGVKAMLARGIDINSTGTIEPGSTALYTPLSAASGGGHIQVVQYLVERGANVDAGDPEVGATPLMSAAPVHHTEIVNVLLRRGANVNARNKWRQTSLHYAMMIPDGNTDTVEALLQAGANVDARDEHGLTPLITLVRGFGSADEVKNCNYRVHLLIPYVQLLLKYNADVGPRDDTGKSALDWANAVKVACTDSPSHETQRDADALVRMISQRKPS